MTDLIALHREYEDRMLKGDALLGVRARRYR